LNETLLNADSRIKAKAETEVHLEKICPVALNLDEKAGYFSLLDCPDGKIRLYGRGKGRANETHVRESSDGITFSRPKVILSQSFICHNFSPFLHQDEFYAVGGKCKRKNGGRKTHDKGLYLLHSKDGLLWSLVQEEPIITPAHPGFINPEFERELNSGFDGMISCVFCQNKFYLYFRANVDRGVRSIQYTTSENLTDWSEIKPVRFNPEFDASLEQNFYGPCFFNFEEKVIGMVPYFENGGEGFIGLFEPDEASEVWHFKGWFNKAPILPPIERNRSFPVRGIIRNRQNPDLLHYYVHENYFKGLLDQPVTLDLYAHEEQLHFKTKVQLLIKHPAISRLRLLGRLGRLTAWLSHKLKRFFAR